MKVPSKTGAFGPNGVNQKKISGFTGGSGLSSIGGALDSVVNDFEKAQAQVDSTAAEEARINYDRDITTILHDPDNGYFNKSGKNAYEGRIDAEKALEIARQNHVKGLSPQQQKMFNSAAQRMQESNRRAISSHASRGFKAWDVATQEASIENAFEKGTLNYQNYEEMGIQLATMRNAVKVSSESQGIGAEATNEKLQTMTSKFYGSVLSRAMEDDIGRAQTIFKKVKKYLEPSELSSISRAMKQTVNKESAISKTDDWVAKGYSVSKGMQEAQKIKDTALREATENRFRHVKGIYEAEQNKAESDRADQVWDSYSRGEQVDEKMLDGMSGKARIAYKNTVRADGDRKRIELERKEKERETDAMREESDYFDQILTSMERDGLRYEDIGDESLDRLKNPKMIQVLKARSASLQAPEIKAHKEQEKIKQSSIEWSTRLALLETAKTDPVKALQHFYQKAGVFKDNTRRNAFRKELTGYTKESNTHQISSALTVAMRVNNITGDSKGKRNAKKAFELMEKWNVYQAGIQAESKRKPNNAETDFFFKEAVREVVTDKHWYGDDKSPAYKTPNFNLDLLKKKQGAASKTGSKKVSYTDYTKTGGSRSWRNNNSGNIEYGKFAKDNGAIGTDGRFAIFPDKETGDLAKISLLKTGRYKNKSILSAIKLYAPQFENNSAKYAKTIASQAGVPVSTKLSSLTDDQFMKMVKAMEKVEGWKEGELSNG